MMSIEDNYCLSGWEFDEWICMERLDINMVSGYVQNG